MKFSDISTDTETHYRLEKNEQAVFFILNQSRNITFELVGPGAEAHVFAFFVGKKNEECLLDISQHHLAPETVSRVIVKSVLTDNATFSYRGTLHIAKEATRSDASQENRNLLLSREARASSQPILEILTSDVRCHHAATTGPLNEEALFFAETRGLTPKQAEGLLIRGFLSSSAAALETLISSQEQEKVLALLGQALQ